MKKQIYSFVALLMLTFACALTAQAQESGESLYERINLLFHYEICFINSIRMRGKSKRTPPLSVQI